jgi:hypothetical protein
MKTCLSCVLVAALVPAGGAAAQGLAEAAAKEKARRKAQTAPAKTYTDADVAHVAPGDSAPADAAGGGEGQPAAGSEQASGEKSPDEQRAEDLKAWRQEVEKAQGDVQRLDAEILRLEAETNDTRGNLYSSRRTQALQDLEKARTDRASAQQKLDDLLESGRRKGFRAP